MIKYTYKGVEHTVDGTTITLTTAQKYLEDNITIEAEGGGGSQYPIIEGDGEHEVSFIDYDGTLLKTQYVNDGESATAPELPSHDRLAFVEWNRTFSNITHDLEVGALYKPTSGNTELFINLTEETGLGITLNIYRSVSSGTISVNWGDGQTSTFGTGTGAKNLTHTYSSYGEHMISIISSTNYGLGGDTNVKEFVIGSNEINRFGVLIKCYCSDKVDRLTSYSFFNNYNLEEFTMLSVTRTGMYVFTATKQRCAILPNTTTTVGNRLGQGCPNMEYAILNNNITSLSAPLTFGTKVRKRIYPENYNSTSYSNMANADGVECIWFKKPNSSYTIGSGFGQYNVNLRKFPMYDNCTGFTSSASLYYAGVQKVKIPASVTTIAAQTFYSCANLTDIYMYSKSVPTLANTNALSSTNALLKIHVYPEMLSAFQSATNWSTSTIKSKLVGDLEGEWTDGYC